MPVVILKDGSVKDYPQPVTPLKVAEDISPRLAKEVLVARVNGALWDINRELPEQAELELLTFDDPEARDVYRHSSAHLMAQAVKEMFPDAKLAIGPAIEDGFYYDFDLKQPLTPADLERIEQRMQELAREDIQIERMVLSREDALRFFRELGEEYKVELIRELPAEAEISLYKQGNFVDLCAGPHVGSTGRIRAFKLTSVAGAYWRGDENNAMLQRVYGTSFVKQSQLQEYLHLLEEAKKRDHRKLGRELDLFSISEEAPGMPFYHPKGVIIWNELIKLWREEHARAGYMEIRTPQILNKRLWQRSGHWDNYAENMYLTEVDDTPFVLKPMNCPGAMLWYLTAHRSYRDLPLRIAELGLVHRHERSGTLHGLMRVRAFTQDDAHIFMLPSQIEEEVGGVIELVDRIYRVFGLEYRIELSTRPEKSIGTQEQWDEAIAALIRVLENRGMEYKVNPGDGAFYGPKIDFHVLDSLKRSWQCATIQLDFQLPQRFELTYTGEDGEKHQPVTVHRVIYGAVDRFLGILIEHFAGAFPVWLAPVQVKILPIADRHHEYSRNLAARLEEAGIRVEADLRNEKIGYKIRQAQAEKVPYMLIVGDKEVQQGTASLRTRREGDVGPVDIAEFEARVLEEIRTRQNN
ncbi:MAG TPA: threonine--tRNA ligase [Bacillota bacterium]|nr:threonine--tRNA ligase [Bacillota bacterium]HQE01694.1 threonine--tRNA ligase [Bacillota bacterium]